MKLSLPFFTAALPACFMTGCVVTGAAVATNASPVGTWTETHFGGDTWIEYFLVIENVDGKLTGTFRRDQIPSASADVGDDGPSMPRRIVEVKRGAAQTISNLTFEDGVLAFEIVNTEGSQTNVCTYAYRGKLKGHTIRGVSKTTVEGLDRFGRPLKSRPPIEIQLVMKRVK